MDIVCKNLKFRLENYTYSGVVLELEYVFFYNNQWTKLYTCFNKDDTWVGYWYGYKSLILKLLKDEGMLKRAMKKTIINYIERKDNEESNLLYEQQLADTLKQANSELKNKEIVIKLK